MGGRDGVGVLSWLCGMVPGREVLARLHACIRGGYQCEEGEESLEGERESAGKAASKGDTVGLSDTGGELGIVMVASP